MSLPENHSRPVGPLRGEKKQQLTPLQVSIVVIGFILVASLGYLAGTFHTQVLGNIKGIFGTDTVLDTSSLQETYAELVEAYDGKIDKDALISGANKGMVDALGDEYTVYMSKEEAQEFEDSLSGNIGGGIGVEVGLRSDRATVVRVLRDNPAEKAGVQTGDVILEVNGESTEGKSVNDVVTKVRGDIGTTVKLTLWRQDKEVEVSVTRQEVTNPSVYSSTSGDYGILTISRFDNDTGRLAREAAREFKADGVKGVVLDLRGNGGGYVDAAKDVASIWLKDKVVVVEKNGSRVVETIRSGNSPILEGVPTVVLVNESSASASEIVAGALQDHKVAQLVGQTTFGKGSVQKLVNLTNEATLKVTIARWYTPSGLNISEKGITPNKEVERTIEDINADRDPQLDAALEALR